MGLFTKRKSRATRRAEARALKAKAKLEAKLAAKNEGKRIKAAERTENKAVKAQVKAQRDIDRTAVKVAETKLRTAREGKLLAPSRIRRTLTASRLLAPVVVPVAYRAAIAARGVIDERRADRLGVPLTQLGQFSGAGGRLSARIAGAEHSLHLVAEQQPEGRRDQAVRRGDHRPTGRVVRRGDRRPRTCRDRAGGRRRLRSANNSTVSRPTSWPAWGCCECWRHCVRTSCSAALMLAALLTVAPDGRRPYRSDRHRPGRRHDARLPGPTGSPRRSTRTCSRRSPP